MRRSHALAGLLLVTIVAGCSSGASGSPGPSATPKATPTIAPSGAPSASGSPAEPAELPELPATFPVIPGATTAEPADDDPGLIASWTVQVVGSAVYDFYVEALPAAGYPIDGLFPADTFAVIRFLGANGQLWQLVMESEDLATSRIEVRLDRP